LFKDLKMKGGVVVVVVDATDVTGSLVRDTDLLGNNPIVVLNKCDLIPESSISSMISYIESHVDAQEIIPISAKTGHNLPLLVAQFAKAYKAGSDVYMLGCTNVGKSKLMNAITELAGGKGVITTSNVAGTTMSMIRVPLSKFASVYQYKSNSKLGDQQEETNETETVQAKESYVYDTPGLFNAGQLGLLLGPKELWYVIPPRQLKARALEMHAGNTYFLGGMVRIDAKAFMELSLFASARLKVATCPTENAEKYFARRWGIKLLPPIRELTPEFPPLMPINIKCRDGTQVHISGVGWFVAYGSGDITVHTPNGMGVEYIRPTYKK
jgi:30S ribosome assembly GTPase